MNINLKTIAGALTLAAAIGVSGAAQATTGLSGDDYAIGCGAPATSPTLLRPSMP
ncbi:hypothetical protein [uncultured Rhodoblastus sp.]|uniref:hypothetical protein n=1 Tax=uncultured Rhodoblastus sp. TaxID=543037 RepID=UPI0025DB9629|nr:hypothetical protein [uncultured Rhodoblastus sp.]